MKQFVCCHTYDTIHQSTIKLFQPQKCLRDIKWDQLLVFKSNSLSMLIYILEHIAVAATGVVFVVVVVVERLGLV